ncbi:unnamed protein product [Schistocephalus solidus]|uniref:Reverse transcriptase domain-containing protein n=1 Tax=Schistocephalus solidus TaxID=70667 RepID=A0A183TRP9_SCHSO|nr:unnamed protein product [Schistocephalus solidus]
MSSGKAPGSDAIPAEVFKHGGPRRWGVKDKFLRILKKRTSSISASGREPATTKKGISLLNISRKIFIHIILNSLNGNLEQGLFTGNQCDFQRHRGTTDMILTAHQTQEKCQEMQTHLSTTFVDLTKAFDRGKRDGLWKIRRKFGYP